MNNDTRGFPGYIASRAVFGNRVPQHIQNLVIREHSKKYGLAYRLSGTEYAMDHCYMMLQQLVDELPAHRGIIAYSMFMLPQRAERRRAIYDQVLAADCELHGAVEDIVLAGPADIRRWEDIWQVQQATMSTDAAEIADGLR